jgi:hypothetical protein
MTTLTEKDVDILSGGDADVSEEEEEVISKQNCK